MKISTKFIPLFFLLFSFSITAFAQTKLSVQGVIRLSDGNAIEDGLYPIEFKLYDTIVGGTLLWSEVQPQLKVTSGIYSTILGEVDSLDLEFDAFYYLSLTVEGEELLPRAPLTSAPYSNAVLGFDNVFPSTGNVGIGTLSPQEALHMDGNIKCEGDNIFIVHDINSTGRFRVEMPNGFTEFTRAGNGQTNIYSSAGSTRFWNDNETRLVVHSTGVAIGGNQAASVSCDVYGDIEYTGTITDVSDRRLKENLIPLKNASERLAKLESYTYNMIDDQEKKREYGLMAQDVQKVFPEMVSIVDPENGYLGVSYVQLVPVLVQATKELNNQIDQLTKENLMMRKALLEQSEKSNKRLTQLEAKLDEVLQQQSVSKL